MIYKSTMGSREWYSKFTGALQAYSILDEAGKVVHKKTLFDNLYQEGGGNVALFLIMEDCHPEFSLSPRVTYDKALQEKQYLEELTRAEITKRAIGIARKFGTPVDFDQVILLMVEAMLDTLENSKEIEDSVRA